MTGSRMSKVPKNVGIAFVTGRRHFQNVLRSYINNWLEHGLIADRAVRLHLFVVYDVNYFNTEPSDYRNVPPELSEMVDSINFYGRKALNAERERLIGQGMIDADEGDLIFGDGYAKKRNAALYFASKKKMDRLLFIDDDEYPLAVSRNRFNNLVWMGQSVLGTHLKYGDDADITHGHHCGYISPIPKIQFDDVLTENDFRNFIDATSNDIVTWESVKKTVIGDNGVTYAHSRIIDHQAISEVDEVMGMKFISGANLCFNLERLTSLPAFYNPPGARGEDAFMSTTLTDYKVVKVPCFTFHDAFLEYRNILNGVLPTELAGVDPRKHLVLERFIKASVGWIRYKPLLTFITQPANYDLIIDDTARKLDSAIPKLCRYFGTHRFEQIQSELERYQRNVHRHFRMFEATRNAWAKVTSAGVPVSSAVSSGVLAP
jgi:hypothetical protein